MAQSTAVKSYDAIGNREDLTDIVSTITRHETPLWSELGKTKATGIYHEWQNDSLSTANDNAQIEGADYSFAIPSARTRTGNRTQIFTKQVEVSGSQMAVSVAGLDDEFAYQLEKRMKEIATDIEKALITGTGNSGASGTARRLKGALAFITTNVETGTGTAAAYLTETRYNNLLQTIWNAGGRPTDTYVNGFQKRQISSFSTPNQRHLVMNDTTQLKNTVSVYESDFGVQSIHLHPFMDTDKTLVLQKDLWKVAVLRGIKTVDVAMVGDAKRGALVGELTLEAQNEASGGKSTSLLTS
jgi:hypothetical protein